ncbi:MAG: ABC transporter permease [Bacillota bacterium]
MKEFFTVLGYTFWENTRKKSFIISTVITLLLTVAVISLPAIITYFDNKDKTEQGAQIDQESGGIVYVVDSGDILKGDLKQLGLAFPNTKFEPATANDVDALKDKVKADEQSALLVLAENNGVPTFDYYLKQADNGVDPTALSRVIKSIFVTDLLTTAGVPAETSAMAQTDVSFNVNELGQGILNSRISSIVMSLLLFFAIYFYGYGVAMSVASEKTSRVMELLVTSTKPSKIILGKSAAMGLLGLIQLSMVVLVGVLTYKLTFPEDFAIAGQTLDLSGFTPFSVAMIVLYFILGYSLYAMMNAVAGATVSKAEDVNSSIMPISMIALAAFYMGYFSLLAPEGQVSVLASIIPFSAPFSMPSRILADNVPAWQIGASLVALVITIVFIAWLSIRIYSAAVLHYGTRLKLKDLLKMTS